MYRIELAPGDETALRSIDELATGIRNGVVTPRARIWHNAGQKWLPIEFHPHYQAALKQLEDESADEPAAPASAAPAVAAMVVSPVEPSAPQNDSVLTPPPPLAGRRPPSIMRSIGLVAGGIVLIVSAQVAASATASDDASSTVAQMAATVPMTMPESRTAAGRTLRPAVEAASIVDSLVRVPSAPPPASTVHIPGGAVVRGPGLVSSAESRPATVAQQPAEEEDDDQPLPTLAPAPAVTGLPAPPAVDDLN